MSEERESSTKPRKDSPRAGNHGTFAGEIMLPDTSGSNKGHPTAAPSRVTDQHSTAADVYQFTAASMLVNCSTIHRCLIASLIKSALYRLLAPEGCLTVPSDPLCPKENRMCSKSRPILHCNPYSPTPSSPSQFRMAIGNLSAASVTRHAPLLPLHPYYLPRVLD